MLLYELLGGGTILTLILPLYLLFFADLQVVPSPSDFLLLLIFASVFTIGPFLLQLQALRRISAFTVNLSYNLEPVYSILFAMLLFNEARALNISFWVGLSLIILSVFLQTFSILKK
jgi:drug/metabolite transporter (DMT)-like permease